MRQRVVAFLSDFGNQDAFAGIVKGVVLRISPGVACVDITHEINPQNILQAAFILAQSYTFFPRGTVFMAIIDPGVGSQRKALLIKTKNYYFIGPDNGILSLAARADTIQKIIHLTNKKYFLKEVSSTFHGRDIFAPVCGWLIQGIPMNLFGETLRNITVLELPAVKKTKVRLEGEIIFIDRFGNCTTNISCKSFFLFLGQRQFKATVGNCKISKFFRSYDQGGMDEFFFIPGSFGFVEVAKKNSHAQSLGNVHLGQRVTIIV